jgi:hypothetical protein
MEAPAIRPRAGIRLDHLKLGHELARRGISAADLAAASGVHEVVLSRARHGASIREKTFRKLVAALLTIPPLDGAAELLEEPVS